MNLILKNIRIVSKPAARRTAVLLCLCLWTSVPAHAQNFWQQTNGPNGGFVYCFAVSGTNLFAGTNGGGVFLSTDNGTSWSVVNTGLTNTNVYALAVSGTNLFAGTWGDGVFLSTNNGTSWSAVITGLTNTNVRALVVSGTNLFAGTNGGGIFLSTNNGTNWSAVNTGLTNTDVCALAVSGTNLFAGTWGGGVFLSTNNGTSWSAVNTGLTNTNVYALAVSGTNLFAGTNGGGVFLSTDNGTSWSVVNTGLTSTYVYALAVSGTNLFAGTDGGGVFLSTNNGTNWSAVNTGLTYTYVYALAVSGTNLFAGTNGGVFLSTNNGTSWSPASTGLTSSNVHALAVSGTNLFAGTNGGVFLSTNNGTSWSAVNTGLTDTYVLALAVSATNLFAGTNGSGVFLSTNNGTSWTAASTGLTNTVVRALAVSGTNIFAGTNGGGVFLSTDNGTSWSAVNTGLTYTNVYALAVSGTNLFAGTWGGGVFLSTNNGISWSAVNTGLTYTYVHALAVSGTNLFAGTWSGVFLSTNNGASWSAVNTGLTNSLVLSVAINSSGYVFAGTNGAGVFRNVESITSAPTAPQNLVATAGNTQITLRWNRNAEPDFLRYRIYGGTSPNPTTKADSTSGGNINDTTKTITGLTDGTLYYFRITAVDSAGNESGYSNEVSVIPSFLNAQREYNPDSHTALLLHLDETNGAFVGDASGHANNGTAMGTTVSAGRFGNARHFNGSTDSVVVPHSPSLLFPTALTFEAWIKFETGGTDNPRIISKGWNGLPNNGLELGMQTLSSSREVYLFLSNSEVRSSSLLQSDRWYHVATTYDGSAMKLYIDGRLDRVSPYSGPIPQNTVNLLLGRSTEHNIPADLYQGYIDEVRLSTIARSPQEFNLQLPPENLSAAATGTTINLSWQNGGGAVGLLRYKIYRGLDSTNVSLIDSTTGTTYPDSGLGGGITYFYRVSAVDSTEFEGAKSFAANGTTVLPPTISSFTPTTGPIGTTVTITGANFNTTTANNIVYFGAVRAAVTSATSISLSVTVPVGTTPGPISVTDTTIHLTAYTSQGFTVTFPSSRLITTNSFSNRIDLLSGTYPIVEQLKDIDGDGKPDIIAANYNSNTISLYRNTSSSGSIAFASKYDLSVPGNPGGTSVDDLDGDGRADIVVRATSGNVISIFRNISSPGSFGFAARIDIATGQYPNGAAINDLDFDGRPDIVVSNMNSNTISAYRNIGSVGNISFAPREDFVVGQKPYRLSVADIDGDGKGDVAVANFNDNSVSVLRNTSSLGTLSFSAKLDFATGVGPTSVAVGDFDGDGKIDLVTSNNTDSSSSVLRNTSVAGTITFASKLDLRTGNGAGSLVVGDLDGDAKIDLAVTNQSANSASLFKNQSTVGAFSFLPKADIGLPTGPGSVLACDVDGDAKPELVFGYTGGSNISILRNIVAPQYPQNLIAIAGRGQVSLKWNEISENRFLRYRIYRDTLTNPTTKTDSTSGGITDTAKVITGLISGQKYYFRITAVDSSNIESAFSNQDSAIVLPSKPLDLAATALSDTTIKLTWVSGGGKVSYYKVYKGSVDSTLLASTDTTSLLQFTFTNLSSATRYFFSIAAVNSGNAQGDLSFAATDVTFPSKVRGLSITAFDSTSITLQWTAVGGTPLRYRVYRGLDSISVVQVDSTTSTTKTIGGLSPATRYFFRVSALNEIGIAGASSYAVDTATTPSMVRNLSATAVDTTSIDLTWNLVSGSVGHYNVYRGTDSTTTLTRIDTTVGSSFANTNLTPATRFFYRISAMNALGTEGSKSYAATAVTIPSQVKNLVVTPLDTSHIQLTWNAVPGSPKRYRIFRGTTPAVILVDSTPNAATSYVNSGLSPSAKYYYQVSAVNDVAVGGQPSGVDSTVTFAAKPLNLIASTIDTSRIDVSWTPGHNGAQSYRMYRGVSSGALLFIAATGSTSYPHTGLTPGVRYYFRVSALNGIGLESPQSNLDSAVTKPSTPRNLVASRLDTSRVFLTWQSGGGIQKQYFIYRGADSTTMSKIDSATLTNYTNIALQPSTLYFYRVSAENMVNVEGTQSYADSAITRPSPVRNLTAVTADTNNIDILWIPGTPPGFLYNLYMGTDTLLMPFYANTNSTSYRATGSLPSTRYYFKIGSVDAFGKESDLVGPVSAVTNPAQPRNFTVTSGGFNRIALGWTSGGGKNLRYRIYRSTDGITFIRTDSTTASTLTDSTLTGSTKYFYRISAVNEIGVEGERTPSKSATTNPATPVNFVATSVDMGQISLTWQSGGGNNAYYKVYRSSDSITFATDTTSATTFVEQLLLLPSTRYYFKVSAVNAVGIEGGTTTVVSQYTRPTTPRSVVATANDTSTVTITWVSGGGAVTRYRIYRGLDSLTLIVVDSTTSLSRINSGLQPSQKYYYRISAVNAVGGEGTKSYAASAVTPPSAPRNLIATALDTSRIRLTWTANGSQDRYYKIRRSADSNAFTFIDTTSLLNYVNSGLSPSTKYFYRVSVVNTLDSEGILSPAVSSITLPVPPRNLSAVAVDSNFINLTWIASGQAAYYKIYASLDTASTFSLLDTTSALTYPARSLIPSTRYNFEVSAVNALAVESQKTAPASTVTKPAKPINLASSPLDTSRISLTWSSGGGTNAKYRIYRSPNDSGYTLIDSTATTTYTAALLSPSVRYYFKVSALNSVGVEGSQSASATSVTFPSMPRNLMAGGITQNTIRLVWKNGGGAVTRYRIYSGPDSLSLALLDSTTATTYDHTALASNAVRAYKVSAVNFVGYEGTRSNLATTTPVLPGEYLADANTKLLIHFSGLGGGTVYDVSGNGNNGVYADGSFVPGKFGSAYQPASNNGIYISSFSSNDLINQFTVEAWVFLNALPANSNNFMDVPGIRLHVNPDLSANFGMTLSNGTAVGTSSVPASLTLGKWYHLAGTYGFSGGVATTKLYINGAIKGTSTLALPIDTTGMGAGIGTSSPGSLYPGFVDEVRVSRVARLPSQFNLQVPPVSLFATDSLLTARLQWQNGGGAVGLLRYKIYRGFDSTNVAIIDSTISTSYVNVGLAKGTRYFYRIAAVDSTRFEGAKSYAATMRVRASQIATALDSIAGLRTGTVGLSFHLPAIVADTLVVKGWYAFQGDTTFRRATLQRSATRLVNRDNVDAWFSTADMAGRDTTIQFYLTVDAADTSARSNTITIRLDNQAPIFAGLDSALADSAQVTLRWRAGSDAHGPLTYFVYRGTTPGGVLVDSVVGGTGRTVTGLSNFTRYYFRVVAQDSVGNRDSNKVELSAFPSTAPSLAFVQVDTSRGGIVSKDVTIRFKVLGDVLDTVQLNVFYSLNDGRTWTKTSAIKENISQRLPNAPPDSVHWDSRRDLPFSESDSMLVQFIPTGRGRTGAATMSTRFTLDNIAPSFGGVQAVDDDTSGNMLKVRWSPATDTHKPIRYFVYVDSGSSTNLFNSLPTQAPADTGIVLRGLSNFMKYFIAVRSEDAAGNRDSNKVVFSGVPTKPLRIDSIIAPPGRWRDSVYVKYYITAAPEDTIHMLAEYSVDAGATWKPAKGVHVHGRTTGDTIITSARYNDTLWWNTKIDSSKMESLNMKLRLTPRGRAATGLKKMSNLFEVDTKEPQFPGRLFVFKNNKDSVFGRMQFGWAPANDLSEPVTYMVFKSETSGVYNKSTLFATTTSDGVTFSGLQSNTLYYLKLWAIDSLGNIDSTYADTSRMTSLLCDYNDDGRVDSRDLPAFVNGWRTKNTNIADIGPVIGIIPKVSPAPDGKIDIEDLTVFIRMWNWAFDHNKGAFNFAQSLPKSYADSVVQAGEVHFPDESIMQPGETKSVALSIRGFKDFSVTMLTMNYDPADLRIDSVSLGKAFGQSSAKPLVLERLDEKRGLMHIAVAALDDLQLDAKSVQQCLQVYVSPLRRVRDEKIRGEYELYASDGTLVQFGNLMMTISDRPKIPLTFAMSQNYPNPFNPSTTIDFQLPVACNVTLKIFNIIGQEVAALINQEMNAGYYDVRWNTSAATGVYFYVLSASSLVDDKQKFSSVKKMMILH